MILGICTCCFGWKDLPSKSLCLSCSLTPELPAATQTSIRQNWLTKFDEFFLACDINNAPKHEDVEACYQTPSACATYV